MLKIRLQRVGRKHIPTFRVVLTDARHSAKSGRFLEVLGSYDPRDDKSKLVDAERVRYWLSKGARLSGTLHNFLLHAKVIEGKKINVLPKKRPIAKEAKQPATDPEKAGAANGAGSQPQEENKAEPTAEAVAQAETPKEEVKA
ncbi:MAG: 30S ribosomal protein S16 [Candidatus Taylorbacteria bacterium]|nr:30S ribosomal protein S16 [Candidatus Taylorbacteria bacterium]